MRRILSDVRKSGDAALIDWTKRIDRIELSNLQVSKEQIAAAYAQLDPTVIDAIKLARARIEAFHRHQPSISWIHNDGEGTLGQLVRPIERVGIYVPGGSAPLPSTVLMTAVPARVAGVPYISIISPPQRDSVLPHPAILVAADIAGVDAVFIPQVAHRQSVRWHLARKASPKSIKSADRAASSPRWQSVRSMAWSALMACPDPPKPWSLPTKAPIRNWQPPTCWHRQSTTSSPAPSS